MNIPNEQLLSALSRTPRPVREFATSDEVGAIATSLAQKYKLHVDTADTLATTIIHTLLGFIRPEELPAALKKDLLLEDSMANALISDINTSVFVPLQQKVREASEEARREEELERELRESSPEEPPEPVLAAPVKPEPIPAPALDYVPSAQPTLPGSPVPAPMPVPTAPVQAPVPAPAPVPPPAPVAVAQPYVAPAPMHGPQPGWHPAAAVHIFVPTTHAAPVHHPVQAVEAAPVQPEPIEVPQMTQAPVIEPAPLPAAPAPAPLANNYPADPYREPI